MVLTISPKVSVSSFPLGLELLVDRRRCWFVGFLFHGFPPAERTQLFQLVLDLGNHFAVSRELNFFAAGRCLCVDRRKL
jgi:hypothetical protein